MDSLSLPRIVATFPSQADAERAVARLRAEVHARRIRVGDDEDRLDALLAGQRREMDELVVSGVVPMSGPQARGAWVLALTGAIVGALLGAIIGVLVRVDPTPQWVMIIGGASAGAMALGTIGFVFGGGRQPNVEHKVRSADNDIVVSVLTEPAEIDAVQHVCVEAGAVDVFRADEQAARPAEHLERPAAPGAHAAGRELDDR